jgi:hypothetical protein
VHELAVSQYQGIMLWAEAVRKAGSIVVINLAHGEFVMLGGYATIRHSLLLRRDRLPVHRVSGRPMDSVERLRPHVARYS